MKEGFGPGLRNGADRTSHRSQPLRELISPRSRDQQSLLRPGHADVEEFHVLGGLGFGRDTRLQDTRGKKRSLRRKKGTCRGGIAHGSTVMLQSSGWADLIHESQRWPRRDLFFRCMNEASTNMKSGLFSLLEELAGTRPYFSYAEVRSALCESSLAAKPGLLREYLAK